MPTTAAQPYFHQKSDTPISTAMRGMPAGSTGLVVSDIDENSTAFDKGLRQGDVIVEAGQKPVTAVADLNAQIKAAKDGGRKSVLLLVRREGRVYAYRNRCPHRGIPLEWQPDQFLDDSGSLIRCSTHGALFLIESGECVAGPCEGQALQALECREDAYGIWIEGAAAR